MLTSERVTACRTGSEMFRHHLFYAPKSRMDFSRDWPKSEAFSDRLRSRECGYDRLFQTVDHAERTDWASMEPVSLHVSGMLNQFVRCGV